ncbi:hypothetical protein SNE40_007570 [Patella caerulea]|uniref:Eukaryotic translation initiation factor 2-alpha kinase 1 n=1 Tax=Patella caerulea TaxID=87958 RepID=A0AAN8PV72_PATCE
MDKRQKTGRELGTQAKFKLKGGLKPIRKFDDSDLKKLRKSEVGIKTKMVSPENGAVVPRSVPNHLLMISILEHLCFMYTRNVRTGHKLFRVLCDQLTKLNIVSPVSCVDEISGIRANCRQYIHNMMHAALEDLYNNGDILALPPAFEGGNMKMNNQLTRVRSEDLINMQTSRYSNEFIEIEKLGKGGFGSVYKVKNRLDGRFYAIKKIKFKHKRHEQLLKILKEVKTLAGFHHTNIVGYNAAWLEYTNSPSSIQTSRSSSSQAEFSASKEKSFSHINEANSRSFDVDFRLDSGSEDELDPVTGQQLHKHYNTSKCTITEITDASDKTILECNAPHNVDEDSHGISQSNTDNFLDEDTNISTTDNLDQESDNKLFVRTLRNKQLDKSQEMSGSSDIIFLDDCSSDENHNSPKNSNISKKSPSGRLAPSHINVLNTKSRSELENDNSDTDSSDAVDISSSSSDSPRNKDNHVHVHITGHFSSKLYDSKSSFITIPQKSKDDIDSPKVSPKDRVVPYRRSVSAEPLKVTAGIQNNFVDNFPHQPIVQLYIQMELCQQTLQMRLLNRNSKLKDIKDLVDYKEENLKIIHQILTGVDYIHSKGLIHRDLKPRNIFLLEPGLHVKIGDFGLATEDVLGGVSKDTIIAPSPDVKDSFKLENLTSGVGTSTYAAPEQLTGNYYDSKSDIYSIGVILFEVFNVFNTEMERHRSITGLRDGCYPQILHSYWPDVWDAIMKMTNTIAQERPTANSLLDSQLFLTKDQMIASLQKQLREKCDYITQLEKQLKDKDDLNSQLKRKLEKADSPEKLLKEFERLEKLSN